MYLLIYEIDIVGMNLVFVFCYDSKKFSKLNININYVYSYNYCIILMVSSGAVGEIMFKFS
jgi:hypothetical protein